MLTSTEHKKCMRQSSRGKQGAQREPTHPNQPEKNPEGLPQGSYDRGITGQSRPKAKSPKKRRRGLKPSVQADKDK